MSLSRNQTLKLLEKTRGAASALLEDMRYIREVVDRQNTSRGELRRLSAVLRQLIVDRDLGTISSPRIGKIYLHSVDNSFYYKAAIPLGNFRLFFTGDVYIYGQYMGSFDLHAVSHLRMPRELTRNSVTSMLYPNKEDPARTISLRLEQFRSQKVICFMGCWFTREDIIKYMANLGSGVHSDSPETDKEKMLVRIRNAASVSKGPEGPNIHLNYETKSPEESVEFKSAPEESVDPVLIELLGVANALTLSPDMKRLEDIIERELSA